jgi:hypothetical protein
MSRIRTLAVVAALAAALTMFQSRPAEAGGGGVIAGIAIGITAAALWHHHHGYGGWYPGRYMAAAIHNHHRRGYHCNHGRCGYYR